MTRKYDSTVARIAGNLLAGAFHDLLLTQSTYEMDRAARIAVILARQIVKETKQTEPEITEDGVEVTR